MRVLKKFTEGTRNDVMSPEEKDLKAAIKSILKDDKRGHKHAIWARLLDAYDINIVPKDSEIKVAATSPGEGIIYINRGVLHPQYMHQLNVLIRHEIAHNYLKHQIRMIALLANDIPELNLKLSGSIHSLMNTLEDLEISNSVYSAYDKNLALNIWVNGEIIRGLVTEMHREDWKKLSYEDMYNKFSEELERFGHTGEIDKTKVKTRFGQNGMESNLNHDANSLYAYKQTLKDKSDFEEILEFRNEILSLRSGKSLPEPWEKIFSDAEKLQADSQNISKSDFQDMMTQLGKSKAIGKLEITNPSNNEVVFTLYTPEEKTLASECLRILAGQTHYQDDYDAWYNAIVNKLQNSDYTEEQIQELLDLL